MFDVRKRLERLCDELAELIDMLGQPCGFGIVSCPDGAGVRLPHPSGWGFVEDRVPSTRKGDGVVRVEPRPWLDPFPSGTACLRWWGDVKRAEAVREWAGRASATLLKHVTLPEGVDAEPGYHGALRTFVRAARVRGDLSQHVSSTPLLDVSALPVAGRKSLPRSLQALDPPPVFTFDDVRGRADRFAHRVVTALLGEVPHRPRLVVDVEAKSVTLDGKTCWPGDVYVRILHELVKARGGLVSRTDMRKADHVLREQSRIDRDIKKLKSVLKIDVHSSPKGYSLPEGYLA